MKSKEEIARLLWTLAGAIIGVITGLSLLWTLFDHYPAFSEATGILPMLMVIGLVGGGLIGGGFLGLWIISKRQKVMRKKYFEEKKRRKGKK